VTTDAASQAVWTLAMPQPSDAVSEGTIVQWLVSDGDAIEAGAELVEIETDKATLTEAAESAGVVSLLVEAGATVAVGTPIATIHGTGPGAGAGQDDTTPSPTSAAPTQSISNRISPLARRTAEDLGVDIGSVVGTGPGGRVLKADVLAAAQSATRGARELAEADGDGGPGPGTSVESGRAGAAPDGTRVEEATRTQQLIARRMVDAKSTIPEFALQCTVDMTAAVALRVDLQAAIDAGEPLPSYNDMIVRAAALALRRHPRGNASYVDGRFELHEQINIGIAVAVDDRLLVPTVRDADRLSLGQTAALSRSLVDKARSGTLTPAELADGTFTVSNLGMFGVTSFTAIINAPQAAILAVGQLEKRPVVRDDEVAIRECADLTLVCDHRILYGADGARLLQDIKQMLEQPLRLMV
jgi:pyruvate dehydrogenase E2 component (dihydrolipoamide acetyltransferase)